MVGTLGLVLASLLSLRASRLRLPEAPQILMRFYWTELHEEPTFFTPRGQGLIRAGRYLLGVGVFLIAVGLLAIVI